MDDYDHILSSDFPLPPDADTTLPDADPEADVDGDGVEDSGEFLPEVLEDEVSPSNAKGKAVTQGMNEEEKKERQKLQNRKAAERSRHKKRQEQSALEISVQHMHVENDQLRKGLATLLASRPDAAASSSLTDPTIDPILSTPAPQNGTGIDYAYLSRLQTELASSKSTLLDKELELARLKGVEVNGDDLDDLRHLILSHHAKLTTLDAEAKSLESTVNHLRSERDELAKQGAVIRRELDMRRALSGIEGPEAEVGVNQAPGEDAALLDVSGWMEAAAKNWDQTAGLPTSRQMEGETLADRSAVEDR